MVKITDIFGLALLLVGIYIFIDSLTTTGIQQWVGIIGSVGLVTIEFIYLISFWRRR